MFHCRVKKEQSTGELINKKTSKKHWAIIQYVGITIGLSESQLNNLFELTEEIV